MANLNKMYKHLISYYADKYVDDGFSEIDDDDVYAEMGCCHFLLDNEPFCKWFDWHPQKDALSKVVFGSILFKFASESTGVGFVVDEDDINADLRSLFSEYAQQSQQIEMDYELKREEIAADNAREQKAWDANDAIEINSGRG